MDIKTKDDLFKVIEDMQSRLAVVEDSTTKKDPEDEGKPKDNETEVETEVETEDEIEKLLNS